MNASLGSGYDVLMVLWGVVFLVGTVGFIYLMNRVFQTEERRQEAALRSAEGANPSDHRPLRPVM